MSGDEVDERFARGASIRVIEARTKEELDEAFRVRYIVFGEEDYLDKDYYPGGRECDSFDTLLTTTNIVALDRGSGIGTVRVLTRNPEVAERNGWDIGLTIEGLYDLGHYARKGLAVDEVPRSSVLKEYRDVKIGGAPVIASLYRKMYKASRRNGADIICGVINLDTDSLMESEIVMELSRRAGLVGDLDMEPRISDVPDGESRFLLYPGMEGSDPECIEEAISGGVDLSLPPMVKTVDRTLGCKIHGTPVYYRQFKRYVVPVAVRLDDIPARSRSYFES